MAKPKLQDVPNEARYPLKSMTKGRTGFRPLAHKSTGASFTDLDYLLLLGEYIQYGEAEWKRNHPNREFRAEGIAPEVQRFALTIYKAYEDGTPKRELEEYIADSIDLDH